MMANGLCFLLGAAIGAAAGWILAKRKYEKIAQEEIESVKETLGRNSGRRSAEWAEKLHGEVMDALRKYTGEQAGATESTSTQDAPYVISPGEFAEFDDYEAITLTYYSDGTLADDDDCALGSTEIEEAVGAGSLSHFGEYEEDAVCVRNDARKCDYEILRDLRTYGEMLAEKPWKEQQWAGS